MRADVDLAHWTGQWEEPEGSLSQAATWGGEAVPCAAVTRRLVYMAGRAGSGSWAVSLENLLPPGTPAQPALPSEPEHITSSLSFPPSIEQNIFQGDGRKDDCFLVELVRVFI